MWICRQISEESNGPKGMSRVKLPDVPDEILDNKGGVRRSLPKSGHAAEDVCTRDKTLDSESRALVRSPRSMSLGKFLGRVNFANYRGDQATRQNSRQGGLCYQPADQKTRRVPRLQAQEVHQWHF